MYPFASPMMMGVSAVALATTTWNPSDFAATAGFSADKLTLTLNGTKAGSRATAYRSSGKLHFEVKLVSFNSGANIGAGVANSTYVHTTGVGNDANSQDYNLLVGAVYGGTAPAASVGSLKSMVAGDILGISIDFEARTTRWSVNGAVQTTTTNNPSGALAPAASLYADPQAVLQLNCGQLVSAYGPPAGFSWWG